MKSSPLETAKTALAEAFPDATITQSQDSHKDRTRLTVNIPHDIHARTPTFQPVDAVRDILIKTDTSYVDLCVFPCVASHLVNIILETPTTPAPKK